MDFKEKKEKGNPDKVNPPEENRAGDARHTAA